MDERSHDPWVQAARDRIERLTMPHWALGAICDLMVELVRIQRTHDPESRPVAAVVFAGDHGIAQEGVSAYPQEVTRQMVQNFLSGGAAISVLARQHGFSLDVVDMGVAGPPIPTAPPEYIPVRLQPGTRSFLDGPAMSLSVAQEGVEAGKRVVERLQRERSPRVLIPGEMGIGNTTSASALAVLLLNREPEELVGRGSGIASDALGRKLRAVREGVLRHRSAMAHGPLHVLAAVGGLEIAGLVGFLLAAAEKRVTVLLDGFIVSVAALLAAQLNPDVREIVISAHRSAEKGHQAVLKHLRLHSILDLNLRLGEASGAAVAWPILDSAATLYREMATFESAGVDEKGG